jgi:hypothetical protein
MSELKISDYIDVDSIDGTELILVSKEGSYRKTTIEEIRNLASDIANTTLADLLNKAASAQDVKNILNTINTNLKNHSDSITSINAHLSEMAIYFIPEMFGAIGDGVTNDSVAIQNAINSAQLNNACLKFNSKKTYLVNTTLNITKRIKIDFNYAKVVCSADWFLNIDDTSTPYACDNTDITNLYLTCVNGIKMNCKRSQIYGGRINNTGIAIKIESGYENIIHDLNLVANGGTSVGIYIITSDCIVNNVTGYGEHTFIINKTYNQYNNIHAWPVDSDYAGSVFYYDLSDINVSSILDSVYSDTYETAFKIKARALQPQLRITNSICSWSNKSSGYLFYNEDNSTTAQYIVDIRLDSKPTTFYLGNVDGIYSFKKYFTTITPTPNNSYSFIDGSSLRITDGRLFGAINGSVNTGSSQALNLKIPNMSPLFFPYVYAIINNTSNNIVNQTIPLSVSSSGNDIILTGTFPTVSGYTQYKINIDAIYRYY